MGSLTRQFTSTWGGTGGSQTMVFQFRINWTPNVAARTCDISCDLYVATNPGGSAYARDVRIDAWKYFKIGNDADGYKEWATGGSYFDRTVYDAFVHFGGTGVKTLQYDDDGNLTARFVVDVTAWNNNSGTHYYQYCQETYDITIENIGSDSSVVYINGEKYIPYINGSKCDVYINGVKY